MDNIEKTVLALLIQQPELLDFEGLRINLFSFEKSRRIFKAIQKLAINGSKFDEVLISKEAGTEVNEILEITEGVHRIPVENFKDHIKKLREAVHHKNLFKELEKQKPFFIKGMPLDFTKCIEIMDELKKDETKKRKNMSS